MGAYMTERGVIERVVFELESASVPLARAAQDGVSRYARAALADSLEAAVRTLPPGAAPLRFPHITLELGELALERIEHELGPRIEAALGDFLRRHARTHRLPAAPHDAAGQPLARLAAWLEGEAADDLPAMLAAALAMPAAAVALLRRLGRGAAVRRRLARLTAPLAAAVVRCLEPEQAATVLAVVAEVATAHRRQALVAAGRQDFALAVWEFVFSYLLLDRGSHFHTRALVGHILTGLANRYGIAYRDLLAALVALATGPGVPRARGAQLPRLLTELYSEQAQAAPTRVIGSSAASGVSGVVGASSAFSVSGAFNVSSAVGASGASGALATSSASSASASPLRALAYVLCHGVLAPAAPGAAPLGLTALLEEALAQRPDDLRGLLRQLGGREAVRARLAGQAGQTRLGALLRVLEPGHGGTLAGVVDAVRAAHMGSQAAGGPAGDAGRPLVQEDMRRFDYRLWNFVLQIVLVERGSHSNTRAFVKSLLERLAGATGSAYGDWLDAVAAGLPAAGNRPRLVRVLDELRREHKAAGEAVRAPAAPRIAARGLLLRAEAARYAERPANGAGDGGVNGAAEGNVSGAGNEATKGAGGGTGNETRNEAANGGVHGAARHAALDRLVRRLARRHGLDVHQLQADLAREGGSLALAAVDRQALGALLSSLHEQWRRAAASGSDKAGHGTGQAAAPDPAMPIMPAMTTVPSGPMARAVREFAVRSLVLERGSWFNDRSYVEDLVRRLARRHGIAYGALLATLARAAGADTPAAHAAGGALPAILGTLRAEQPAVPGPSLTDPGWIFLRDGHPGTGPGWRRALLRGPALGARDEVLAALRAGGGGELAARLADYLDPASLRRLLDWLSPSLAGALAGVLDAGGATPPAWRAMLRVLADAPAGSGLTSLLDAYGKAAAPADPAAHWRRVWRAAVARRDEPRFAVVADLCETALRGLGAAPRMPRVTPNALPAGSPVASPNRRLDAGAPPAALSGADLAQALARLLRHGIRGLDAWRASRDGAPDNASLFAALQARMAATPRVFVPVLREACARPLERERLAHLLPAPLREPVLRILLAPAAARALGWRAALAGGLATLAPRLAAQAWRDAVDAELLRVLGRGRRRPDLAAWLRALGARVWREAAVSWPRFLEQLRRETVRLPAADARADRRLLAHLAAKDATATAATAATVTTATATTTANTATSPTATAAQWATTAAAPALEPPILVGNAGLVLLWPFFSQLFASLDLTAGGQFRGADLQARAVHLLDYLVWGERAAPEEELALPKLLCGLAPDALLAPFAALEPDPQERELCASLLGAAIAHWGRLGNSGPEALQQTFLQRAGALRPKDDHWQLSVPEQAFDVLLTTLPWALGPVRLSWMKGILWVSWK